MQWAPYGVSAQPRGQQCPFLRRLPPSLNPSWWSPATVLSPHQVLPWLSWLTGVDIRRHRANPMITSWNTQQGTRTGCRSLRVSVPVMCQLWSCGKRLRMESCPGHRAGTLTGNYRGKPQHHGERTCVAMAFQLDSSSFLRPRCVSACGLGETLL